MDDQNTIGEALASMLGHFNDENYAECLSALARTNLLAQDNVAALRDNEALATFSLLWILKSGACDEMEFPAPDFLFETAKLAGSLGPAGKDVLLECLEWYPSVCRFFEDEGIDGAATIVAADIKEALTIAEGHGYRDEAERIIAAIIGISPIDNAILLHLRSDGIVLVEKERIVEALKDQMVTAANWGRLDDAAHTANWLMDLAPEVLARDMIECNHVCHPCFATHTPASFAVGSLFCWHDEFDFFTFHPLLELMSDYGDDDREALCAWLYFILEVHNVSFVRLLDELSGLSELFVAQCLHDRWREHTLSTRSELIAVARDLSHHESAKVRQIAQQALNDMGSDFHRMCA